VTVNVGVIGAGMIGQDHIRRITRALSGARVAAVTDLDLDRAKSAADSVPGSRVHHSGLGLVADESVDAVVVCSWGPAHPRARAGLRALHSGGWAEVSLRPRPDLYQAASGEE
jgi:predicted dehydrogenase